MFYFRKKSNTNRHKHIWIINGHEKTKTAYFRRVYSRHWGMGAFFFFFWAYFLRKGIMWTPSPLIEGLKTYFIWLCRNWQSKMCFFIKVSYKTEQAVDMWSPLIYRGFTFLKNHRREGVSRFFWGGIIHIRWGLSIEGSVSTAFH